MTLGRSLVCGLWSLVLLAGCASRPVRLPADPGSPLPDPATVLADLTAACSGVRTLTGELGLSGRAGGQRLRGRAVAGFEAPRSMRLEGLAPFGAPAFILASSPRGTTLLLPRDDRVLEGAKPEEILGALTGVALAPADLMAILTGCVVPSATAVTGFQHRGGWTSIELADGTRLYATEVDGVMRVRAATRGEWQIEYPEWQGRFPSEVRLVSSRAEVDMTAQLAQLETNIAIQPAAFTVDVPADAIPIDLDDLRRVGPLRDRTTSP